MHSVSSSATHDSARLAFAYLAERDALPAEPCDAILGFGVFDLTLPRFCGELYVAGRACRIIFTGGRGAGSADLVGAEADAWFVALMQAYPRIPRDSIILENRSTDTGKNVSFTADLLAREHPHLLLGKGIRSVIAVAAPSRLRRVRLTLQHPHPALRVFGQHHAPSFESEQALYASKGLDFVAHLAGELDRIIDYAERGWLRPEPFPPAIAEAHAELKQHRAIKV